MAQCNFIDPLCRLLDDEIAKFRPDLLQNGRDNYHRNYYRANREKKIAAARKRNNTPEYRLYQIEYQRNYRANQRNAAKPAVT